MANSNQLSRYGAISRIIPKLNPGAKLFLVSDSDDTTVGPVNLGAEFPVDNDGVVRVYTTIQAAVNAATANRGDVVLVLPGYDHTLSRADSWATAGVSIIGLGEGMSRPIIRYGTKTDEVGIAANNVTIENLRFLADADSTARALDLDTGFSGHVIRNCVFDFDSNAMDFRVMLRVGSARTVIENNQFWAEDTAGCGKGIAIWGGYPDFLKIRNNFFYGQFDTVGDTSNTSGAIACDSAYDSGDTDLSGLEISNNTIVSTDTAASTLINLSSAGVSIRGIVMENRIVAYDTAAVDTNAVTYGGAMPMRNIVLNGDSDTTSKVVEWALQAP
jgi:hypothetical protein